MFVDVGLLIFLLIIFLIIALITSAANWMLDHLFLIVVVLIIKSVLFFGGALFIGSKSIRYYIGVLTVISLDIVRSASVMWGLIFIISFMVNGSFFDFLEGLFVLVVFGCFLLVAAEAPMYPVLEKYDYDDLEGNIGFTIGFELLAIAAVTLLNLLLWVEGV